SHSPTLSPPGKWSGACRRGIEEYRSLSFSLPYANYYTSTSSGIKTIGLAQRLNQPSYLV
ncbi:hypothetical protein, partial [Lactobacillus delbrueckii]|uniref:hypothetical protein n=1 Tax=Lactobacillus delbrueckii TaxID=1584 RepID=UPI0035D0C413